MKFKSVPLPNVDSLPKNVQDLLEQLPSLNVYKMFANLPSSLPPFIELAQSFFNNGTIKTRLLEIAILRVAYINKCNYQWHQHEQIARSLGIDERDLAAIANKSKVKSLNPDENFICTLTDELTKDANLSDKNFEELFARYTIEQGVAIILCISFYNMLSRFLNATRVHIEKNNPLEGKSSPL